MPDKVRFTMIIGDEAVTVTVYKAVSTHERIPKLTDAIIRSDKRLVEKAVFTMLVFRLSEFDLEVDPNPTKTLKRERDLRIDTQPATAVFRNIHLQRTNLSWAVVTIQLGGQLCFPSGYGHILLRYLRLGLLESFKDSTIWTIRVTVERKKKGKPNDQPSPIPPGEILWAIRNWEPLLKKIAEKRAKAIEMGSELMRNASMITRRTEMILHIEAVIEKHVAKLAEEEGAQVLAKKIPIVSTIFGFVFGGMRLAQGDVAGAIAEVASGVLADIPGAGTAASVGIDVSLLSRDIANAIAEEKNHKKIAEAEKTRLENENQRIKKELAQLIPESPMYGSGCSGYFHETDFAYVDDIVKIHVNAGDLVDGIQIEYRHAGVGKHHGGQGGTELTFHLDTNERIIAVSGSIVQSMGQRIISSLTFTTDNDREVTYGSPKAETFTFEMNDGAHLAAIKGYDFYGNGGRCVPGWSQNIALLPAVGFIAKY